jgi:hypothetical protein
VNKLGQCFYHLRFRHSNYLAIYSYKGKKGAERGLGEGYSFGLEEMGVKKKQ